MTALKPSPLTVESDLPEGWTGIDLGACATRITKGATPTTYGFKYKRSGIAFVRVENLANGRIKGESIEAFIDEQGNQALGRSQLRAGDILFSIAGTIGRTALVEASDLPANTNQALAVIRDTGSFFVPTFLRLVLESSVAQAQASNEARGGAMNNISLANVRALRVPIPPLAEQERIVEKVEQLLARVKAARERLARVPVILKRFRQAVLAAACSGRLTADWRGQAKIDPRWIEEIEGRLRNRKAGNGSTEWHEPDFEIRERIELPEGWHHIALGNLGEWATGGTPATGKSVYWDGGTIPWLSPKDMKAELIVETQDHITERAVEETRLRLIPTNSLLFVVRGLILARLFPVAILSCPVTINQDIRAVIPNEAILPEYLLRALQFESHAVLYAVRESTHGTRRLESPTLKRWPIPLPPVEEQSEIVRRVEALFALADTIEKRVAAATARADKLTRAILAKAFRGELVPTEAELARREGRSYEPASVLVERIQGERSEIHATQPGRTQARSRRPPGKE